MARFRTASSAAVRGDTVNLAGGRAYTQSNKVELITLMATTFLKDQFYRSADDTIARLKVLVEETDPEYAAKAAILVRHEYGNRSVSHLVAGELVEGSKGKPWASKFYQRVCRRGDDPLEILGYLLSKKAIIPSRVKRGLGKFIASLNSYELGKYASASSELKMVDAINILHPPHTEAIQALVKGTLASPETWEVELTRSGTSGKEKKAVWRELLEGEKLGYMALVRNIRNIVEADRSLIPILCTQLKNREAIKKSLIYPFRFKTALDVVRGIADSRKIVDALDVAIEASLDNIPKFEGATLIAMDCSGSMERHKEICALFGVAIARVNDADLMQFDDDASYVNYHRSNSILSTVDNLPFPGGGTDFREIFLNANKRYDRIVILSDMQSWVGYHTPEKEYKAYCQKFGVEPKVFSFDLTGYGSTAFPARNIYQLAGFSADSVFKVLSVLEMDRDALINQVEAVTI